MTSTTATWCPLCGTSATRAFASAFRREYDECDTCQLVFLRPEYRLCTDDERKRYSHHQNSTDDQGYRQFLRKLSDPLLDRLRRFDRAQRGLDYGCGPGPVLANMLSAQGHVVDLFDPFFAPNWDLFETTSPSYDFVVCTEAAEHFYSPMHEFKRMVSVLKPGGWLGVMTSFLQNTIDFAQWYYPRDPTHCCFYRRGTLDYLSRELSLRVDFVDPVNVVIFHKAM